MPGVPVYFDESVLSHDAGPYHPDTAQRVRACVEALKAASYEVSNPVSPARTLKAIYRVHSVWYADRLRRACQNAPEEAEGQAFSLFDSPDNAISKATFDVSVRSVGLALAAADAVMDRRSRRAFVAVRPPGHHALSARAMGFCFFNTAAVVAKDLLHGRDVSRVLVADFDVHHGNGTQEIFWEDERVAYLSVHRFPFYPGTGASSEGGTGPGLGTTVNIPRPAGAGDDSYAGGFEAGLERLVSRFHPDVVLVSAGFDAHERDPLGGMHVTTEGFARMTRALREAADTFAGGRVISLLEGGYAPEAVAEAARAHLDALEAPD